MIEPKLIPNPTKILFIDLGSNQVNTMEISQENLKLYLGGKGLAYKILYELLKDRLNTAIDPLSPDNPIIFMTGPLTGTGFPLSSRFSAVSKSPLTNLFGSSNSGGPFGIALKTCGYMGLVLTGKAEKPVKIIIDGDKVSIESAEELWGKTTLETLEALKATPRDGTLVIGPAGENLVRYACIRSGDRFLGRLGFGAVLGSKKVKAILVKHQNVKIEISDKKKFESLKKTVINKIKTNPMARSFKRYGTNTYILLNKEVKILPCKNFSQIEPLEEVYKNSGPYIEEHFELKPNPCPTCAIVCGQKMKLGDKWVHRPEYETNALFGPNMLIFDIVKVAEINEICNELGLDTISTAGTIAYLMEAEEKGILHSGLKFGDAEKVKSFIKDIVYGRTELAKEAGKGSRYLAEKYGGNEFAIQVKGLEIAAYDPRNSVGHGLNYAVANRGGCHLSAPVFPVEAHLKFMNPHSPKGKATIVIFMENLFNTLNSIITCVFTTLPYMMEDPIIKLSPKPGIRFLMKYFTSLTTNFLNISIYKGIFEAVSGIKLSKKEFLKAGGRIHLLERYLNITQGLTKEQDTLPERFLTEIKPVPLAQMLKDYYKKRGYDENGKPKKETLRKVGINVD